MGKLQEGALASLTSVASGAAVDISKLEKVQVNVAGTFVGTWFVEISYDKGTTWATWATGSAGSLVAVLPPCGRVRGRCSAFTSGTIVMSYGGNNPSQVDL